MPLAVFRARRGTEAVCDKWHVTLVDRKPLPTTFEAMGMVSDAGCRFGEFMALNNYLQRCLEKNECPDSRDMAGALLPRANKWGLVYECFRRDLPARD